MQVANKLTMLTVAVKDMPKAKEFYADTLGLETASDYRRDDDNWWASLSLPEGVTLTLTTYHENMQPGTLKLYFATSDVSAAHEQLSDKGVKVSELKKDLHGPGSSTKWFSLQDPDGNQVIIEQA